MDAQRSRHRLSAHSPGRQGMNRVVAVAERVLYLLAGCLASRSARGGAVATESARGPGGQGARGARGPGEPGGQGASGDVTVSRSTAEAWADKAPHTTLHAFAQVLHAVEPVGDLERIGGSLTGADGIVSASSVATNDLDAWIDFEPIGQRLSPAVGQQIPRSVAFPIDENRAVATASAEGKGIHA